jgi:hypothetical protein
VEVKTPSVKLKTPPVEVKTPSVWIKTPQYEVKAFRVKRKVPSRRIISSVVNSFLNIKTH